MQCIHWFIFKKGHRISLSNPKIIIGVILFMTCYLLKIIIILDTKNWYVLVYFYYLWIILFKRDIKIVS